MSPNILNVLQANFRPFSENDWHCFAGVEGTGPRIAELGDDEGGKWIVVADVMPEKTIIQVHPTTPEQGVTYQWELPTWPDPL